jgi:hypothetical protein
VFHKTATITASRVAPNRNNPLSIRPTPFAFGVVGIDVKDERDLELDSPATVEVAEPDLVVPAAEDVGVDCPDLVDDPELDGTEAGTTPVDVAAVPADVAEAGRDEERITIGVAAAPVPVEVRT